MLQAGCLILLKYLCVASISVLPLILWFVHLYLIDSFNLKHVCNLYLQFRCQCLVSMPPCSFNAYLYVFNLYVQQLIYQRKASISMCSSLNIKCKASISMGITRFRNSIEAKTVKRWVAAIAPWFCLRHHPAALGSYPKHTLYAFSICIIEIVMRKEQK